VADLVVVLATYNGGRYLRDQLDSLRAQSLTSWRLLVRDDGSKDETPSIIREYSLLDDRIHEIHDDNGHLGASGCFARLLEEAHRRGAKYVACSDQDDVWHPDRLKTSLKEIMATENKEGVRTPVLVSSDLAVVDEDLGEICSSFMKFENIANPSAPPLSTLLVQNHVVGCTLIANRALLDLALPVPAEARMHDWWLALCAKAAGVLRYVPVATVKYRQHSGNVLGARGFRQVNRLFRRDWVARLLKRPGLHKSLMQQAECLGSRLRERQYVCQALENHHACRRRRFGLLRVLCARRHCFRGQNWLTTALFYFFLFFGYPKPRT
jgi:glycosyltransferase involved in cell wall biosynthesis